MSFRDNPLGEIRVPLVWTAAVALIVALIVAVTLLLGDRRETLRNEAYGVTREVSDAVAAPVSGVVSAPVHWMGALSQGVSQYFFAVSENRRLRAELEEVAALRQEVTRLQDINARYVDLLGLRTDPPIPMVSARVVSDSRGPFANTRLANVGRERQVQVGNPVMTEYGLVGRVVGVTRGASRILMLTDIASRTPVMVDRTNARAILAGDGGPNPKLEYLRGHDPVKAGDRIVTSGDGGLMPRGLPVGVAVKGIDGAWRVVLASEAGAIDFVRILLFEDFSQLVDQNELNTVGEPPVSGVLPSVGVSAPPPPAAVAPPPTTRPPAARPPPARTPAPKTPAPKAPARPAPAQSAPIPAPAPDPPPPALEEPVF